MESLNLDVRIIGGGYTGLSTALHLAEQGYRLGVSSKNKLDGVRRSEMGVKSVQANGGIY